MASTSNEPEPAHEHTHAQSAPGVLTRVANAGKFGYFAATVIPWSLGLVAYYAVPNLRPRRSWTWLQAIMNDEFRAIFDYQSSVRTQLKRSHKAGAEKDQFIMIKPADASHYDHKPLNSYSNVKPVEMEAIWYPKPYHPEKDAKKPIILHMHAGAFVLGDDRQWKKTADWLAEKAGALVLILGYRYASSPDSHFPAQLQDVITGYRFLLDELKIDPKRVVLSGDSAGGNLVLAFLRFQKDNPGAIPKPPSAAIMASPWVNLATDKKNVNEHENHVSDYLNWSFLGWGIEAYTSGGIDRRDPYISPALHPFRTDVPLWLTAGTGEVLINDIERLRDGMRREGNDVEYVESTDANHDPMWAGPLSGFEKEAARLTDLAGEFVKKHVP